MSKQCPSDQLSRSLSNRVASAIDKKTIAYWKGRIFKNTFTRNGERVTVNAWSVKIQHQGQRRTFSLGGTNRETAAQRALELYQIILHGGWKRALEIHASPRQSQRRRGNGSSESGAQKQDVDYWKYRLIHRNYLKEADATPPTQYSIRIEHDGINQFFPLGTNSVDEAAASARDIYLEIERHGWDQANQKFQHEITVAIFWSINPTACIYSSLITGLPKTNGLASLKKAPNSSRKSIFLVDADKTIADTLIYWFEQNPSFRVARVFDKGIDAFSAASKRSNSLVLANQNLPDISGSDLEVAQKKMAPSVPMFTYGVYEDSDQYFTSLTGVEAGYLLRRRPPKRLLEPISFISVSEQLTAEWATRSVRDYFQNFFDENGSSSRVPELELLTYREKEIMACLCKGYLDKEIADMLKISAWTVHNHLKKIYGKLGVHTRTEAVVKYLHK